MMKTRTLRFRMMLLFGAVVGVLLAASYLAFWLLLGREVRAQLDRQLLETARPVAADLITDPTEQDVNQLSLPGEYFVLLDSSGHVLQHSQNLRSSLDFQGISPVVSKPTFVNATDGRGTSLRAALLPFERGPETVVLVVATPTLGTESVLGSFRRVALLLFPLSLLVTAAVSSWYVGRSLAPVTALTEHAARMARRVAQREEFWMPVNVASPHDELGRLAETFNQLLGGVDSALRQLRQFATDAAHELRTPLSILQGETELLLSRPRSAEECRKTLCVLDDELKKLTRIVEGLFTLSMADAGQLRLKSEPLYLNEVLEEACALVTPRANAKNIAIRRELRPEVACLGDEAFLHQLFLILLDNAIKYSPPETRVSVSLEKLDRQVRVRFEDHGIGISSDHLPHIFERFYRATPSASETQSGGLGLAIAQAIVCAHGGSIECQSTPGAGSTFTVVLPLSQLAGFSSLENESKRRLVLH